MALTLSQQLGNDILLAGGFGEDLAARLMYDERTAKIAAGDDAETADIAVAMKLSDRDERIRAVASLKLRYPEQFVNEDTARKTFRNDKFALMKAAMKEQQRASQLKRIGELAAKRGAK